MKRAAPRRILLTGMPGSGKEEFVSVCQKKGYRILRMGDFVRAEVKALKLEMTDANVGGIAQKMREKNGFDYWARKTLDALDQQPTLIDGVRGSAEVACFKKGIASGFTVVAVHASPRTRYERLVARGRSDAPKSAEEFEQREQRELRWGLGDVIARADKVIVNESSLDAFRSEVRKLLEELDSDVEE